MSRRVMMVAYGFPPVAGAGIERTLKHTTYLPDFGWEPVVVAPSHSAYRLVDPDSVSRIRVGTEVHRAPTLEPAHARRLVGKILGRGMGRRPGSGSQKAGDQAVAREVASGTRGWLREVANAWWARGISILFFPDEQLLWVPSAVIIALRAHSRRPVDLIYSSSAPISSHLAAGILKAITGAPWVADFRDPWIGNVFARPLGLAHRAMQRGIERAIAHSADRMVFPTQLLRDAYAARYPGRAHRFVVIPNGYDQLELSAEAGRTPLPRPEESGTFLLVYTGSIYGRRDLSLFLDGVDLLLHRRPELKDRLRVEFIGWLNEENTALAMDRLPALDPVVRHIGFLPRPQAIARLRAADAGLILIPEEAGRELFVGTKVYEYLGLDKPVLAITPAGETQRMLQELDWGVIADPSPDGVARGLEDLLDQPEAGRRADPERRFERRNLSRALAALLDEVQAGAAEAAP